MVYPVPDLEKAKSWYGGILETEPVLDAPFAVIFPVGDSRLILVPNAGPESENRGDVFAYWEVDDIDSAHERLLQAGAISHTDISTALGVTTATVLDPFGNILGITGPTADLTRRSVTHKPSKTAAGVAFLRALAAIDERAGFRGPDFLAAIFLDENGRRAVREPATRQWLRNNFLPPGAYEYIIARTAYFDGVVEQALRENIPQIVFLGAGYDSRAYRFKDLINETRIFELDIHPTQKRKREILHRENVSIPEQLTYVSINFNTDTMEGVLSPAGFEKGKKTLFIWEGVTYYMLPSAVDDTLRFIRYGSPPGSMVCFDYNALSDRMADAYGVREMAEFMKSQNPEEPIQFGIREGEIESFLSERGFRIVDHLTAEEMERKYLTLPNGSFLGKVPAIQCFARAEVTGFDRETQDLQVLSISHFSVRFDILTKGANMKGLKARRRGWPQTMADDQELGT
jgi:methyltransferase (TIGR00027 family)